MFPKTWERGEVWAKCPDCGYVLRPRQDHACGKYMYHLGFIIHRRVREEQRS